MSAAAGAPPAEDRAAFIRANTRLLTPPLAPEMRLHLADDVVALWTKTEEELQATGLPPPFWAFAWAGGQALARWIGDRRSCIVGRRVLDFASGSGMIAIAAALAGAAKVEASEIDPFAQAAIALNAGENRVAVDVLCEDRDRRGRGWDVVLAGDVAYERDMAAAVFAWLEGLARRGALVLVGDRGAAISLSIGSNASPNIASRPPARSKTPRSSVRACSRFARRAKSIKKYHSGSELRAIRPVIHCARHIGRNMQLYYATHDGQAGRIAERIADRLAVRGIPSLAAGFGGDVSGAGKTGGGATADRRVGGALWPPSAAMPGVSINLPDAARAAAIGVRVRLSGCEETGPGQRRGQSLSSQGDLPVSACASPRSGRRRTPGLPALPLVGPADDPLDHDADGRADRSHGLDRIHSVECGRRHREADRRTSWRR